MENRQTETPALVMGATEHGSLGIIRSLGSLGVAVFALEATPTGPAASSKYCRKVFNWDFIHDSEERTLSILCEAGKTIGKRSILIPTWDEQTSFVDRYHDLLSEYFIFPKQPEGLVSALTNKASMRELARQNGISSPSVIIPADVTDLEASVESAIFPVILKRIYGNQRRDRAPGAVIVQNKDELLRRFDEMREPVFPNVLLQEYIPCPDTAAWLFNGYFDENSKCVVGFTGHKIRHTPIHSGMTSLGICRNNPEVQELSQRFLSAIGYRGMVDIDYCYDARDQSYKILDVNPRIGASFRLFVDKDGLDVVRAMYLNVTGQRIPDWTFPEGRKWLVERDFNSALQQLKEGSLTFREWRESLRGVSEYGYFAWNDPLPVLRVLPYLLKRSNKHKAPTQCNPKATQPHQVRAA